MTVVARFRPQNKTEIGHGAEPIVDFESEESCRIEVRPSHILSRVVVVLLSSFNTVRYVYLRC